MTDLIARLYVAARLLCVLCFSTWVLTACSDKTSPAPELLSSEEQLFQRGSEKARMCVGCHGPKGISRVMSYPSLAGKSPEYLAQQLHAFRDGSRENPMMSSIAQSMADEDIQALSHYFSRLPAPELDNPTKGNEK
jgi:cytochrome c553